jgi:hypothetical protein
MPVLIFSSLDLFTSSLISFVECTTVNKTTIFLVFCYSVFVSHLYMYDVTNFRSMYSCWLIFMLFSVNYTKWQLCKLWILCNVGIFPSKFKFVVLIVLCVSFSVHSFGYFIFIKDMKFIYACIYQRYICS